MAIKSNLIAIWQNRRHFKLQIFGIMVFCTILIFAINLLSIKVSYEDKIAKYTASTAKYTTDFQMSLSGVKGTVDKVYIDSSKTQCFILATLSSTSTLSTNANNYQMFVTNVNNSGARTGEPNETITGEIYMFGSSGIVGLYLKSDKPFDNNLKELILRSYTKYTANSSPYVRKTSTDAEYDQCHVYFNPGANNVKTIDFLEKHVVGSEFNLTEIYRQISTVTEEIETRDKILTYYKDINVVINKILEYRKRLINSYNIDVPDLPTYINGDYFDNVSIYDAEGNEVGTYQKYVPATIVPGGTEFDWYVGSVLDGYFKLVPNTKNMTIRDYVYALSADKATRSIPSMITKEWYYKDGTAVRLESDSTTTTLEAEIARNITAYEDQLTEYVKLKSKYQTEYLPELLLMEYNSGSVGQVYSVRNDENTVIEY